MIENRSEVYYFCLLIFFFSQFEVFGRVVRRSSRTRCRDYNLSLRGNVINIIIILIMMMMVMMIMMMIMTKIIMTKEEEKVDK